MKNNKSKPILIVELSLINHEDKKGLKKITKTNAKTNARLSYFGI